MIFAREFSSLKVTWPIRKSEWALAAAMLGIALVLSLNDTLFTQPGYRDMAIIAPQWVWQWMCFLIGLGRIITLIVNGAYWRSPHWRALFAFLSCFVWYRIGVGFSSNFGFGLIFATTIFSIDVFNLKQAAKEAATSEGLRDADRKHRAAAHH